MKAPDPLIGRVLGGYEIIDKLGEGGMGAVYKGRNTRLGKLVAIKLLQPQIQSSTEFTMRFRREAQMAAKLDDANIVRVFDFGEEDGIIFFVMEYVEGQSLAGLIRNRGRIPVIEATRVSLEIARGLKCAHDEGLVHRDIKPDNIMISKRGQIMITDFGLVKQQGDAGLTNTGAILGTPYYMSPEQCEGLTDIDHRTDLYSLGLIFYVMVTGTIPVKGKTPLQIIHSRVSKDVPPAILVNPEIPQYVNDVIMSLVQRDRDNRTANAGVLIEQLEAILINYSQEAGPIISSQKVIGSFGAGSPNPTHIPNRTPPTTYSMKAGQSASGDTILAELQTSNTALISQVKDQTRNDPSDEEYRTVGPAPVQPPAQPGGSGASKVLTLLLTVLLILLIGVAGVVIYKFVLNKPVRFAQTSTVPAVTKKSRLVISGTVDKAGTNIQCDCAGSSQTKKTGEDGKFSFELDLKPGQNAIQLTLPGAPEKSESKSFSIIYDAQPPEIVVMTKLKAGKLEVWPGRVLKVVVNDQNLVGFTVNGNSQSVKAGSPYEHLVKTGESRIKFTATDAAKNRTEKTIEFIQLSAAKWLKEPPREIWTRSNPYSISGKISQSANAVLKIDNQPVTLNKDGSFKHPIKLSADQKTRVIQLVLRDSKFQSTEKSQCSINFDTTAPQILIDGATLDQTDIVATRAGEVSVRVVEDEIESIVVTTNGQRRENYGPEFTLNMPAKGNLKVSVVVKDKAGNKAERYFLATPYKNFTVSLALADDFYTNLTRLKVRGQSSIPLVRVQCDGIEDVKIVDKAFEFLLNLKEGRNDLEFTFEEESEKTRLNRTVIVDKTLPKLELKLNKSVPGGAENMILREEGVINGRIIDRHPEILTVNSQSIEFSDNGSFSLNLAEFADAKSLNFLLRDRAGNQSEATYKLIDEAKAEAMARPYPAILYDDKAWQAASPDQRLAAATAVYQKLRSDFDWYERDGKKMSTFNSKGQSYEIAIFKHKTISYQMLLIPGGTYTMGGSSATSQPKHTVTVQPFLLGRFEFRQRYWKEYGGAKVNYKQFEKGAALPVMRISWFEARDFGKKYSLRLPTEAEWEYAARAGTSTDYYWGKDFDKIKVRCAQNSTEKRTKKEAFGMMTSQTTLKLPGSVFARDRHCNAFGVSDILGNVAEWCEDSYFENFVGAPQDGTARLDKTSKVKVVRGGSFQSAPNDLTVFDRKDYEQARQSASVGVRYAFTLPK